MKSDATEHESRKKAYEFMKAGDAPGPKHRSWTGHVHITFASKHFVNRNHFVFVLRVDARRAATLGNRNLDTVTPLLGQNFASEELEDMSRNVMLCIAI